MKRRLTDDIKIKILKEALSESLAEKVLVKKMAGALVGLCFTASVLFCIIGRG